MLDLNYKLLKDLGCKDKAKNLLWRDLCWRAGYESQEMRDALWVACSRDILFWCNTFVWIQEVRGTDGTDKCIPFITYEEFQDDALLQLVAAVDDQVDILIEKSRDMGASWMCLLVLAHKWLFRQENSFMLTSRTEALVDKTDDVDTLFGKLEYMVKRLPAWMKPGINVNTRSHMKFLNSQTGSICTGSAASRDAGVGGRKTAILMDEFALQDQGEKRGDAMLTATRNNTACRLFNSTPRGIDTAHYRMACTDIRKIRMHWTSHPLKNQGLYKVDDEGEVTVIDTEWHEKYEAEHGHKYAFVKEPGATSAVCRELGVYGSRSPYYDAQCKRTHSKIEILQEEDIDYLGSGSPFFDTHLISTVKARDSRKAIRTGRVSDFVPTKVRDKSRHSTRIWYYPNAGKPDQQDTYTIAVDIAMGTGASDSAITVYSDLNKADVLEFVSNSILPEDLAQLTADIYKHFTTGHDKPFLIWDGNGPGQAFGKRIIDIHRLGNIFYYTPTEERGKARPRKIAGWPSNAKLKYQLFEGFRDMLAKDEIHIRSEEAIDQLEEYVFDGNGGLKHVRSESDDPSANKEQHGDVAMTKALASWAYKNRDFTIKRKRVVPVDSLAWRRKKWAEEDRMKKRQRDTMFA